MTWYDALPIGPVALKELRVTDDAGYGTSTAAEGDDPLRCCLRGTEPGERTALVAYAPLRRWAAQSLAPPGPALRRHLAL
jgi:hypothetical protein